jgi:hypothetical protein
MGKKVAPSGSSASKSGKNPLSLLKFPENHAETVTYGIQGNESTE